ncbi:LacI family DNA-binding transcriptional regulator [Paracoccus seriniphilus]|uniref:LacI family DNA-binding transcriptional regulator n=1 Tax=Paracoccus seriniphilus TaxID=184748 RepID=UPI003561BF8D
MSKPRIHTMKELSQAISISRPTLARFFEDENSVLPSTAEKIRKRLAEVDYVYNFLATRQNRKSTGMIGVVIPHFEDLFFASLLDSIDVAAREAGFTMITQSSHGDLTSEMKALRKLRSMNVDGAIVSPLGTDGNFEVFKEIGSDFPIVFADSRPIGHLPKADFAGTDNMDSIGMMVEYLCRTGAPPVFLAMPKLNSNAVERQDAYFRKMQECGAEGRVIETPTHMESWEFERFGFDVMNDHFSRGRYVDATILCANDRVAIGAIRAATTHGLFTRTGEGLGRLRIAGHDDHPLSRYIFPALTTVAQEVEGIGRDAVSLLVNRLRNGRDGDGVKKLRGGSLKIRESA